MAQIRVRHNPNTIQGLAVIEPTVHGDSRGYFMETYNQREFAAEGLNMTFVQDNQSMSRRGVLRGLHYQKQYPQGKLVRAIAGSVYDVAVDIRKKSRTYGRSFGVILSEDNRMMFYIPQGFAHGFLVLSETAVFTYKTTDFWHPDDEGGLAWNDAALEIEWPLEQLNNTQILLSEKDRMNPTLQELESQGFRFEPR